MRKIFAHCFLNKSQKKFLEKNFFVNIHNANEKILSPDQLIEYASGYEGIISQGNLINNQYIKKIATPLKLFPTFQ